MISEYKRRGNDKYNAKCDAIQIRPLKEEGQKIRAAAAKSGKSLQKFIMDAINEYIANHPDLL